MSSPFQQEWQSGNQTIAFPFSEGCQIPSDFIVDLRLFLSGTDLVEAYVSSVSYDETADAYTISFARKSDNALVLSGSVSRLPDSGGSRAGFKQSIASGAKVCLFTPGAGWDDPSWGGAGDWTVNLNFADSAIAPDRVNPGPSTFKGIFIDGDVPDESEWGGVQKIHAGYSVTFSENRNLLVAGGGIIDINAVGGSGDGFYPEDDAEAYLYYLNGASPDSRGNIRVDGIDCIRTFQPESGGAPVPATLQVNSDCLPCCPCGSYRNFSRSIGRRSAKLKDLCDRLTEYLDVSVTAYNDAIKILNERRRPLVAIRNIRVLGSKLVFSSQNLSVVPVFAYVQIRIEDEAYALGDAASSEAKTAILDTSPFSGNPILTIADDKDSLPALPFSVAERPTASVPGTNFGADDPTILLRIGSADTDGALRSIAPGEIVIHTLSFPDRAAALDLSGTEDGSLAAALPKLTFQTLAVYGTSKSYACSAEEYKAKTVENVPNPDEFESCETPFADQYTTVRIE